MSALKEPGAAFGNGLLSALPRAEYERLSPHLELVRLTPGKILATPGDIIRHAYFPKGGMISLLSVTEDGRTVEVAMVGSEGMTGTPVILRSREAPYQVMVQLGGNALRIRAEALGEEFNRGGMLQDLLLRYAHALLVQVVQAAACNRFHTVEERFCRWLLAGRDHVKTDTIQLTHEFISQMLGVPRTSVSMVAAEFRKEGLIEYGRGRITIVNREALAAASCECYRRVREGGSSFLVA